MSKAMTVLTETIIKSSIGDDSDFFGNVVNTENLSAVEKNVNDNRCEMLPSNYDSSF